MLLLAGGEDHFAAFAVLFTFYQPVALFLYSAAGLPSSFFSSLTSGYYFAYLQAKYPIRVYQISLTCQISF